MEKLAVERTIWINASRERVWKAITDPIQIGQWWPPDEWQITALEIGGRVQFGVDTDAAYATITVLDPPQHLMLQWDSNERFPVTTMMTNFTLTEENGGTRVNVIESGFESLPEDIRHKRAEQTAEGYTSVLNDLKEMLERSTV